MNPTRITACLLALVAFLPPCNGQSEAKGSDQDLPIEQIRKTVVYLQGEYPCHEPRITNGTAALAPDGSPIYESTCAQVGTGFLLIDPLPELGPGTGLPLLVTSKHLIKHQILGAPKGTTQYFERITAIANTLKPNASGSYIAPITVLVKDRGFLMCSIDNSDVDADIAVCPISIPDTVYDFKGLPPDILVTQEAIHSFKLNETDDVLFSGLFLPYHGANRNYPIVRHGKLALIPQEKIPWSTPERQDLPLELYLAEVTSWSGNSGSPVFVRLSGAREEGGAMAGIRYLLLGVMMGYFNSDRPAALDTAAINETAHLQVNLSDNSGIAAVVPAQKILDIISQPRIKAYASLIKAVSHAKAGRVKEAEASFKDAIDVLRSSDPNHPLLNQATLQYAQFLRENGRYPEANFQTKMANSIGRVSDVPDDQLR